MGGSYLLIEGAVGLARARGRSELVSGLTVAAEQAANLPSEQSGKARNKRLEPARMIQFIPGGTGTAGVIPVQTLRLE